MNSFFLYVGDSGNGTLNIEAGGQVTCFKSILGNDSGSTGTATVTGTGSLWTINANAQDLVIGNFGSGTLNIEAGGQVRNGSYAYEHPTYLGYHSGSTGTATVTGTGSKWINGFDLNHRRP